MNRPKQKDVDRLVRLFAARQYPDVMQRARAMTLRFPLQGFGWKALGTALIMMGRPEEALAPMHRAVELMPEDAHANTNLGNALRDLGRPSEAELSYRTALDIAPDYAEAHSNLGNALHDLGRLEEAESCYRTALRIQPDLLEANHNFGNALLDMGRLEEAEASYRRALRIWPDYALAHSSLGNLYRDLAHLDEAEASCRQALAIDPRLAEAHNNLGNVLRDRGRLEEAEACYRTALGLRSGFIEAHNNLALLMIAQGKPEFALGVVSRSLEVKESPDARAIFVDCVKRLAFSQDSAEIRAWMIRALDEPWGRPSDLARPAAAFIVLNPKTGSCMARACDAWPARLPAQELFGADGLAALDSDGLMVALLDATPVCDEAMERFLTQARGALLETAVQARARDAPVPGLRFCAGLARQCYINEYVFCCTEEESEKASRLRDSLVAALESDREIPALWPVAVAAYTPLCSLPCASRLLQRSWPEQVAAVLAQQIREPDEERSIRPTIARLTDIEDGVSMRVKNQYEENPYPRWVRSAHPGPARTVAVHLAQKFPMVAFDPGRLGTGVDILIAGCGTGQHSIETARRFHGAQILAVDLSLASLSYAERKTRQLGLTSIDYAQADLLRLAALDRAFDVIECVGVLHHLADPLAGWRVLLSLLKPGGVMNVGLYSELARREIVRIRDFIAQRSYGTTAEEIRRCRQDLIDLQRSDFAPTLNSPDFFATSSCRDLLFHVQEQCATLEGIERFLAEQQLVFLGFDVDARVRHAYRSRFPSDPAATDLGQWRIFEEENPDTFVSMYQFWIQKRG